jgi:hypothetical protein
MLIGEAIGHPPIHQRARGDFSYVTLIELKLYEGALYLRHHEFLNVPHGKLKAECRMPTASN